jgi:hypothetical protein
MEKRMPRCLGMFEADDPQCDGNAVGKTAAERAPCVYRDRCAGFIKLMDITKRPREFFVREAEEPDKRVYTYANSDDFEQQLLVQIDQFGIHSGRATTKPVKIKLPKKITPPPQLKPGKIRKATQRAGAKARNKTLDKGREKCEIVAKWFVKKLCERLKRKLAAFEQTARPGDMYLVDKLATSGYCAIYCKGKGRRHGVASFINKPLTGKLEIRLACEFANYEAATAKATRAALAATDHTGKDGAFKVRFQNVDAQAAAQISVALCHTFKRFDPGFPEARGDE